MSRIRALRVLASVMLLFLPALFAAPVHAQPDAGDSQVASAVTLRWPALGMEREVVLGPDSTRTFTVPVPTGLSVTRLRGTINAPMNITAGYLEIDDADGKLLGTVDLPPAGSAQAAIPMDVDISAARVRASSAELSLTVRALDGVDRFCGPLQQLALTDLSTVFTGTEPPVTTIANFFPPVLERVSIYAPKDADSAEQQSVLRLVSTLTRLYDPQLLDVTVVNQQRGATPPRAGALTRTVVVEKGGTAGLRVENAGNAAAYLRVSGTGGDLSTQVSLLANDLQTLAQAPVARVEQAGSGEAPSGDVLTFGQLDLNGRTEVLRSSGLRVGVGRSALGSGRVDSVQVHLLAHYTPVPDGDAAAVVIRSSDGNVVYTGVLDNAGRLDATFVLRDRAIGQFVSLDFALTYSPRQACGPLTAPITFQIDPRSSLTVHRGGPPPGGFSSIPAEFGPSFLVAFDGSGPNQLGYAADVVAAVARLSSRQLTPEVVDLKTAADADSAALIVANSSALKETSLRPPVSGDGGTLNVGLPSELRASVGSGLGSVQAFADRSRNRSVVLVTTTGAWSLVDPLFGYLAGLDGEWAALTGDVLAAGEEGVPTNLTIFDQAGGADVAEPSAVEASSLPPGAISIAAAAAAAIGLTAGIVWLIRRRRSRTRLT
ncbi:hypothetical protein C6A87_024980 [Mycobacterium sp. ITM-2016-00317]|uniref:hypothetical protein n=1 Tax=Mycobacterium sp. ITM-2016-00317 TaxID=2099694 RepID=UPI00287FA282|nr:hypothetical protein [Mycobacterium sp. ITM-2016-00317]WNG87010.1 hypothetical protein C6A87_024980 [Mycobacterium sp. ITM-2016-00317]